ncbi:ArsC/Spx/MgsR family protein [Synechocystis sp. LKSZ1]|uniref:ArsC/Spx/MgsR family protein n=1 Tax=Synechocystis sp. LKSZ1 TaxID=3144951 RepID=UPI00336C2D59
MVAVIFYEKPGCINNTKQKALLTAAGHAVEARNLLTEPWTPQRLQACFGDRLIGKWFNPTAPAIKSGQVHPKTLDVETALQLMIQDPLLIRRPILRVGDRWEVGFDLEIIDAWIGLKTSTLAISLSGETSPKPDLETCPPLLNPVHPFLTADN